MQRDSKSHANVNSFCNVCDSNGHQTHSCPKLTNVSVEERADLLKLHKLCFKCLSKDHFSGNCTSNVQCTLCKGSHHTLLHRNSRTYKGTVTSITIPDNSNCLLPCVTIPFHSHHGVIMISGLLDTGSQRSFIHSSVLNQISHKVIDKMPLKINGFGGTKFETCRLVSTTVSFDNIKMNLNLIATDSFSKICVGNHKLAADLLMKHKLSPIVESNSDIKIVIGADYYYRFVTGKFIQLNSDLCALETIFGWTSHGLCDSSSIELYCSSFNCNFEVSDTFETEKFWDNELTGILPSDEHLKDSQNFLLEEFVENITRDDDGRYNVSFPWKSNMSFSSNYYNQSQIRLNHNLRKLIRENILADYDAIIKEYLKLDIIELVPDTDNCLSRYLPHHCLVKQERETTKVRIVFDGSAKAKGENSLNDCLYEGINLFPSIIGILLRFRLYKYALIGDIEKAFLQIGLKVEDRNSVRFIWFDENLNNSWPTTPEVSYRFKRVPFGVKSSPFLLNATVAHHLDVMSEHYEETASLLKGSMYVDDMILSSHSIDSISKILDESIQIFRDMQMKMHKFKSNVEDIGSSEECSILGLKWNTISDSLYVKFSYFNSIRTKRQLTSLICSLFDPLGYYSPFVIKLKIILQDVWFAKLGWDDTLPDEVISNLDSCINDIESINAHRIPRHIGLLDGDNHIELYAFADASERAYSACIYLKVNNACNLIISKTRLAPKRTLTLPRLELMGCLIVSRLLHTVIVELHVKIIHV